MPPRRHSRPRTRTRSGSRASRTTSMSEQQARDRVAPGKSSAATSDRATTDDTAAPDVPATTTHAAPTQATERTAMTTYQLAVIPGDGVGTEVIPEGLKVLRRAGEVTGAFD